MFKRKKKEIRMSRQDTFQVAKLVAYMRDKASKTDLELAQDSKFLQLLNANGTVTEIVDLIHCIRQDL